MYLQEAIKLAVGCKKSNVTFNNILFEIHDDDHGHKYFVSPGMMTTDMIISDQWEVSGIDWEPDSLEKKVGSQIHLKEGYTATCQKINKKGDAIFLMDQLLDEAMPMNGSTYETSELRKRINSEEVLKIFGAYREKLVPFKNGDLVRIPSEKEMFQKWELMRGNAEKREGYTRKGITRWYWLRNKISNATFAHVSGYGLAYCGDESCEVGVRLTFKIRT